MRSNWSDNWTRHSIGPLSSANETFFQAQPSTETSMRMEFETVLTCKTAGIFSGTATDGNVEEQRARLFT